MTTTAAVPGRQLSRIRRITFTALSVSAGVYATLHGVMGLWVFGFDPGNIHRVQQLGLGVFWTLAVAAALLLQARAPQRRTALFQQLVAAAVALLVASTLGSVVDSTPLVMVVAVVILGALHPARKSLLRIGQRPSVVAAALVIAAAVPLVLYGLGQTEIERTSAAGSLHTGQWTHMAALAFAIPLVGFVAALRAPGWRISAWSAGVSAVLLGVGWLAFPDLASAPDTGWSAAAIAGGAAFIGLCEQDVRRLSRVSESASRVPRSPAGT